MAYDGQQCQGQSTTGLKSDSADATLPWSEKIYVPFKGGGTSTGPTIKRGWYNPDSLAWASNPIATLEKTLRYDCFWGGPASKACELYGDPAAYGLGPSQCELDPIGCISFLFGGLLLATSGPIVASGTAAAIDTGTAAATTIGTVIATQWDRIKNLLASSANTGLPNPLGAGLEQIGTYATKSDAKAALSSLQLTSTQIAKARAQIQRATSASTITITRQGDAVIVDVARPGVNGYQLVQSVIGPKGTESVTQFGIDALGRITYYDPKFP